MNLFRQYHTPHWIGGVIDSFSRTTIITVPVMYLVQLTTLWQTGVDDWLHQFAPWISYGLFIAGSVFVGLILMLFARKFLAPSSIGYANNQIWEHDNPIRTLLEDMSSKIEKMEGELHELRRQNGTEGT